MNIKKYTTAVFALLAVAALSFNADTAGSQSAAGAEDPFNVIHSVTIDRDGRSGRLTTATIPSANFYHAPRDPEPKMDAPRPVAEPRIQPRLEQMINERPVSERVEVLVNLRDDVGVPRLPDLPYGVTRESAQGQQIARQQQQVIDDLHRRRGQQQAAVHREVRERLGGEVKEHYWLVNAFVAEVPLGSVRALAQGMGVLHVQLRYGDVVLAGDVEDGRERIRSDPYFDLGLWPGYIGVLDTGVRASHTLLTAPDPGLGFRRDCVNGGMNCDNSATPGYDPGDNCGLFDGHGHGTGIIAILIGNANKGDDHRGVTTGVVDSFRVMPCGESDKAAIVRGFQAGLSLFDRVFVAALGGSEPVTGTLATAADNAFDAGAVVVAANMNDGPGVGTVDSPALAHKVIGVGAYDVGSLDTYDKQSRGPAPDGRKKPDIQTPTNTETAGAKSNTDMWTLGGTSGATPYAGGAAALMRAWLKNNGTSDPGQVYSRLIMSGQHVYPYNNEEGAGDLRLPLCSTSYWSKVSIKNSGATVDIPIPVSPLTLRLDAALWWPEQALLHNDIDVYLIDPSGKERAKGYDAASVFERVRAVDPLLLPLATGTWKLRIKGFDVSSVNPQTVYWHASVGGC